jgi:hypothetical protein
LPVPRGIARADEPIGWYDKILQLAGWPEGLLESVLISEARRCGTQSVVAFASAATDTRGCCAAPLAAARHRRAARHHHRRHWRRAMHEVPRRLGQAFSAFWNHQHGSYPPGTTELLR